MEQPQQQVGDVIERQRRIHEEAHRRALARNDDSSHQGKTADAEVMPVSGLTEDGLFMGYAAEETAGALTPQGPRNWNNGEILTSPAYVPSAPLEGLHPDAEHVGGALSGVDAICGFSDGRK